MTPYPVLTPWAWWSIWLAALKAAAHACDTCATCHREGCRQRRIPHLERVQ